MFAGQVQRCFIVLAINQTAMVLQRAGFGWYLVDG